MKKLLLAITLLVSTSYSAFAQDHINFEKIGIIREFGGTDNAALFGLRSNSGAFKVTQVTGPGISNNTRVGVIDESTIDKLFATSSKPMNQTEKIELLTNFKGGTFIYTEGYKGNLCTDNETQYEIVVTGSVNAVNVEVTFQFQAQPNPNGDCKFQIFGIIVR